MNRRQLALIIIVALAGYGAFYLLFPGLDPSARWKYSLDRSSAIEIARKQATAFGYDVQGWDERVTISYSAPLSYYLANYNNPIASDLISPLKTLVAFRDLRLNKRLTILLNPQGKLIGLRLTEPQNENSENSGTQVANSAFLDRTAASLLGQSFSRFTLSDAGSDSSRAKKSWGASDAGMRLLVSLSGDGERLTGMTIEETPTAEMRDRMNARRGGIVQMLLRAGSLIFLPLGILITIFYISGLARRQIDHATTLIFFLTAFILTFGSNLFSEFADDLILSTQLMGRSPTGWAAQILPRLLFLLINLVFAFGAYATWAASVALSLRVREKLMLSLELLLKGRLLTVPVAGGFVSGIAFAGLLAALPYLVISTGLFRGAVVASTDAHTVLAAQAPWLAGLVAGYEFEALVIFAFTGSLIYGMIRRRAVARALLALIAFATMINFARIDYSAPAVIVTGILATALLLYLYNWFGILSVLTAVIATQYIASGAALLVQSSDSLLRSGWTMIVFTALAFIAGLVALSRSREATPEELAVPEHLVSGRIERERLKAEFDVARKAQQKMLPDSEPQIEGLDIAAICQPSKEVGGDLFDFLRLKDGRLGIVVADVSGKGVPASLYMTLTKGLLDSVSEIETDPGMILREVNRHLYEVCQRRVFVTLFLGILDPVTGHFEFARAGHNPPVLHRPHDKATLMLKPRGMGLGLNSGRIFDQSIQVDSTNLGPGDILLIYSDGITEAMNHRKEEFGEDRLQELAGRLDGLDARGIKTRVFDEVSRFLGNIPPQDDQTLVVVKRI